MGEEITAGRFSPKDFVDFKENLTYETGLLESWFRENIFNMGHAMGGFELEAWIVDKHGVPLPLNEQIIALTNNPMVVPELSMFNVELNGPPQRLEGNALNRIHSSLAEIWESCGKVTETLGANLMMIGILPTAREQELTVGNMSHRWRYRALNEQILSLRSGSPLTLNIHGHDDLNILHADVMLEAATTSFQIHLQVNPKQAVRFYNAALILSAPMVAVSANSPFLFGKKLWSETRIPLFEQAVSVCSNTNTRNGASNRVVLGSSYAQESMLELFLENLHHFPVLLPTKLDEPPESLSHLRLHNGTIWRWNRPIIGFGEEGTPHLRIEHRVVSAGPTVVDCVANAALFFGLMQDTGTQEIPLENQLSFQQATSNFYDAAKFGLDAKIRWSDGREISIKSLFKEKLLKSAHRGLNQLGLDRFDIDFYLGIIEGRINNTQNGSTWQQAYVNKRRCDMHELTGAYLKNQQSGRPVHEWSV